MEVCFGIIMSRVHLKHVQKNKMGFVSIKLLTSLKKVGSPLRWPAGVGSGLHVEDAWVSGCALAVCGEVLGEVQALLRLPVSRQSAGGAELGPAVCLQRAAAVLHPGRVAGEAVRGPQTPSPGLGSPLLPVVPPGCSGRDHALTKKLQGSTGGVMYREAVSSCHGPGAQAAFSHKS